MTDQWTLTIEAPGHPVRTIVAVNGLTLGRHPSNACIIQDETVSGRHAVLIERDGRLAIQDLGSNNGTRVEGDAILGKGQDVELQHDMRLRLGRVAIRVAGPPGSQSQATVADAESGGTTAAHLAPGVDSEATVAPPAVPASSLSEAPDADVTIARAEVADATAPSMPLAADEDATLPGAPLPDPGATQAAPAPASAPAATPPPAPVVTPPTGPDSGRLTATPPAPTPVRTPSGNIRADDPTLVAAGDGLGEAIKLKEMRARLVIVNEAEGRRAPIDRVEYLIGRSDDAHCRFENQGVSSRHARITFSSRLNTFRIEDLGSANGTRFQTGALQRNTKRELEPDAYLRFGPIEAIFLIDLDADLEPLSALRHESAIRLLQTRGKLDGRELVRAEAAAKEESISVAEALLMHEAVAPKDWAEAVREAPLIGDALSAKQGPRGGLSTRWLVIGIAIVVLALSIPAVRHALGGLLGGGGE